jgi:carbon monoxide dehydrogenase subunit G
MTIKVGPVSSTYRGKVVFERLDPAGRTAELSASGQDVRGKGGADLRLTSTVKALPGGQTEVTAVSVVNVTGILAQMGRGMIQDVSDEMFQIFSERMRAELEASGGAAVPDARRRERGLRWRAGAGSATGGGSSVGAAVQDRRRRSGRFGPAGAAGAEPALGRGRRAGHWRGGVDVCWRWAFCLGRQRPMPARRTPGQPEALDAGRWRAGRSAIRGASGSSAVVLGGDPADCGRTRLPVAAAVVVRSVGGAMIPASFDYHAPGTLPEALALLSRYGDDAKVLSGGQSLLPLLKLRLGQTGHLIDIGRIPGLEYIREEGGFLRIGGRTRESALEASELIRTRYPILHDTAKVIADPLVRNLATIGGNLAHGDPGNDHPATMLALGAEVVATGPKGERVIPIEQFFLGLFRTALRPDEVLTEIRIPDRRRARVARTSSWSARWGTTPPRGWRRR